MVFAVAAALLPAVAAGQAGGPGHAGSSGDAAGRGPRVAPAQPAGALPGIDVSHHQDTIDWAQVAGSGVAFAIAKASEGQTFVDPMYAANRFGAQAYGIEFGAYHFARPDDAPNDAVLEADHFVDTAQLAPGNLIPVLDIERTGGLSQAEVTNWILTWLGRVTERLGVRPMVYTSPNGWETRTGDTTAVADAGYTVLWVAHWHVSEPRLPAGGWSGNGWTFWQHSNCGSVPGIEGCVDLDWYESSDLLPVTIPSPDVTPPTATLVPPADVTEPVAISFSEIVRRVGPDNVHVSVPETGERVEAALACRSRRGAEVDCGTGNVRTALVQPASPLLPGESYEAVVNPAGAPEPVVDRSGNPVPTTLAAFAPPTELEEGSEALTYAWRTASNRRAFGRSYAVERTAGATASFDFRGRSVTWYTATGPDQGRAAVRIDGVPSGTFDQYAPGRTFRVARRIAGLERGEHTITVRVLGAASPDATDTQVVVDAFEAGGQLVANPAPAATWGSVDASRASAGAFAAGDLARASVELRFKGAGVVWHTVRNRNQGRAAIYLDGVLLRTVDNYAATPVFGVLRSITGLTDAVHTLRIVALGEGRPAARATQVAIDRFAVLP